MVGFAEDDEKTIYETKQYDIGYLWRVFGKYATTRNLRIGMDVQKNSNVKENLYNLNFSVAGEYVNISQFISDIENNSDLNFRIYNFKMSGSGEEISATFTIKNVNIESLLTTQSSDNNINTEDTSNAQKNNNSNTNSTTTTNNNIQNSSSTTLQ